MPVFRKARSPFWHFDFRIQGYRFSGSTKCEDEHDAALVEKAEKAKAREIVRHIIRTNSAPLAIGRAADRWWNEHGQHLNESGTRTNLDWLVANIGATVPLHEISDDTVSRLVELRRRDVKPSGRTDKGVQLYKPITARTVNKSVIDLLRRVMRRARDNWKASLPTEPVWKRHRLKEQRRQVRELSASEEQTLDAIENVDYAAIRRFAIITGLRRRTLLLTWSQVDFELGVVRVLTKGGTWRTIPLTREAYQILWSRRGHHPEFVFTYVCQKSRTIPKGKQLRIAGQRYPITYSGLGSNQENWKKAGVDGVTIHTLRHTTGMRTLRQTGNLRVVQKILGHTDIKITAQFYTDATVDDMRAAMEATGAGDLEASEAKQLEQKKEGET